MWLSSLSFIVLSIRRSIKKQKQKTQKTQKKKHKKKHKEDAGVWGGGGGGGGVGGGVGDDGAVICGVIGGGMGGCCFLVGGVVVVVACCFMVGCVGGVCGDGAREGTGGDGVGADDGGRYAWGWVGGWVGAGAGNVSLGFVVGCFSYISLQHVFPPPALLTITYPVVFMVRHPRGGYTLTPIAVSG